MQRDVEKFRAIAEKCRIMQRNETMQNNVEKCRKKQKNVEKCRKMQKNAEK